MHTGFAKRALILALLVASGCGTTRMSDTKRTATEQLLISDAMDRAVSRLDFRALAGKTAYLDSSPARGATDQEYLVSALRQHMLASGCALKDKREEADYIVELRIGAVGTDRHEVLFGVPATKVPEMAAVVGVPSSIPELPLAKKTEQRAVTKLAVFAYNRNTGRPVWQSGVVSVESEAKDVWVFGAGPFQRGSIYQGTKFAGDKLKIPLIEPGRGSDGDVGAVPVADEAYFVEPAERMATDEGSTEKSVPPDPLAAGKSKPSKATPSKATGEVKPAQHKAATEKANPGSSKPAAKASSAEATAGKEAVDKPQGNDSSAADSQNKSPQEAASEAAPAAQPQALEQAATKPAVADSAAGDGATEGPAPPVAHDSSPPQQSVTGPAALPVQIPEPRPLPFFTSRLSPSANDETRVAPMMNPGDELPPIPDGLDRLRYHSQDALLTPPNLK